MLTQLTGRVAKSPARVAKQIRRFARFGARYTPWQFRAHVLKRGSWQERQLYYNAARLRHWKSYQTRVALAQSLAPHTEIGLPDVPDDRAVMIYRPTSFPALDAAIAEARADFGRYVPGTTKRDKDSLEGVKRASRGYKSAVNRLAMHPEVLRVVSNYMGILPILYRINLLYSPNNESVEESSQFFHLDPEDIRQLKIFVSVQDVDEETGPLSLLPANRTEVVRRAIGYRGGRVPDEQVFTLGGEQNLVKCVGPAGTMAFGDTCRCFHMGSRKGSRPRYVIMIQYVSPYAANFPIEGDMQSTPMGRASIPAEPTVLEQYLLALKR